MTKAAMLLVMLFVFAPKPSMAQDGKQVSLQQAIGTAIKNNAGLKAGYELDHHGGLRKTAGDIGKTNVSLMMGQ